MLLSYTVLSSASDYIIKCFFPRINHTFNAVYSINLYDSNFHFIFDNVGTNGLKELKELYKDAPDRLLAHMVDHIKQESEATTRDKTKKVDVLFGNIQISHIQHNGVVESCFSSCAKCCFVARSLPRLH